jgi:hypothetical protein
LFVASAFGASGAANIAPSPPGSASPRRPWPRWRITAAGWLLSLAPGGKIRQSTQPANGSVTAMRAGACCEDRLSSTSNQ